MKTKNNSPKPNRREFLLRSFSSCALCCMAATGLTAAKMKPVAFLSDDDHKFLQDSGMSIQQVYNFAYKGWYIPAMKNLMEEIGREKFLEMLRRSSDKIQTPVNKGNIDYKERTMKIFAEGIKKACENWKNRLTFKVISESENEFEMEFTECLWAKTFREAGAEDIGYAGCCHQDYASAKAFNPDLELVREKTLMQGGDCCHFKWKMKV
jgi:hypothetical protein